MEKKNHYVVIDDDRSNNLICEFVIRQYNPEAEITVFTKPEKGLEFLRGLEEDPKEEEGLIVFLDINMPEMSGWELLDSLKSLRSHTINRLNIFMVSSSVEDFTEKSAEYPFVLDFLSKPLSRHHLDFINEQLESMVKVQN